MRYLIDSGRDSEKGGDEDLFADVFEGDVVGQGGDVRHPPQQEEAAQVLQIRRDKSMWSYSSSFFH